MRIESILITDIEVTERRREDFGDLEGSVKFDLAAGFTYQGLRFGADYLSGVGIHPSLLPEHWHLSVVSGNEVTFTIAPVWKQNIDEWFRLRGERLSNFLWSSKSCRPSERNPYDVPAQPKRQRLKLVKPAPKKPEPPVSYVYFFQAGDGAIKIGVSNNPARRLKGLSTASPTALKPLGAIKGDVKLESSLHKRFSHLRLRREWFAPDAELLDFIKSSTHPASFRLAVMNCFLSELRQYVPQTDAERHEFLTELFKLKELYDRLISDIEYLVKERREIA